MIDPFIFSPVSGGITLIADQAAVDNLSFEGNKTYLFKRGEYFRFTKSFSDLSDVVIGAYGSGNNPVLTGGQDISSESWSDEGSGIYSLVINEPKWIEIVGQNSKYVETDWIQIQSIPSSTQIGINALDVSSFSNIVGSKWVCRSEPWTTGLEYEVTAYSNGTITLDRDHTAEVYEPKTTRYFKLLGKLEYIQNDFEWAYEGGSLYVKLPSAPSNYEIVNYIDNVGLNISGGNGNRISNLDFNYYFGHGILASNSNNILIQGVKTDRIRHIGVTVNDCINLSIKNSNVSNCGVRGISGSGENAYILNSTINNIGNSENICYVRQSYIDATSLGIGISLNSSSSEHMNMIVDNCHVYNIAYVPVINASKGSKVRYCILHDYLTKFMDGGAVYSYSGEWLGFGKDLEVSNCIIYNAIGNQEGIDFGDIKVGIYFDNRVANSVARNNVIYNVDNRGDLFSNGDTENNTYEENLVITKSVASMYNDFYPASAPLFGNNGYVNRNNIYVGSSPDTILHSNDYATDNILENDYNYYINPFTTNVYLKNEVTGNFAGLQAAYNDDQNSVSKTNWLTYVDEATAETQILKVINEGDDDMNYVVPSGYEDKDGVDRSGQTLTVPSRFDGRPGMVLFKTSD